MQPFVQPMTQSTQQPIVHPSLSQTAQPSSQPLWRKHVIHEVSLSQAIANVPYLLQTKFQAQQMIPLIYKMLKNY